MKRSKKKETIPLENDPLWYKDAIIYQVHVRAFYDSNQDGIGDFAGLVQKLDYLQDLGVTALWLLPFYPSPLRDDGYDIADYTDVHPMYGTLSDFKVFLREAHRRGLRVITELVVNHTSDQHPWFQRARRAKAGSTWRNFYVWSDTPDKYKEARIIFKDFEASNWTWDPVANAYYWHRFYDHQPDLNYDHPEVHEAIFDVLDFWLGLGIDGLRLDAIPYLYEREGTNCENLPETHAFLKKLRRHVDEKFPNRMLLAEANQWPEDAVAYFGNSDECHMAFHFPVMPRLFMGMRMEDRFPIVDIMQQTPAVPESSQWAIFLRNHDELTLEMVTDEDRDYMYRVYAQDPQARINLGIRRRLAPLLENHRGKIELMNGLLFSLPGTPIIYYGDEIGMGDNIYLGDRNSVRTPMQWSAERNAGFSRANPQRLFLPVIIDPAYHFEAINVEAQQNDPHSLLWWMKHLIAALRKRYKAFGRGSLELLYPENHKILAFVRRYEEECLLVVANLSRFIQYVELDLSAFKGMAPVEMLGRTTFPAIGELPYLLTLGPHAFYWFSLEPKPDSQIRVPQAEAALPVIQAAGPWDNVFRGQAKLALERILPAYLKARGWLVRRASPVETAKILETIPVPCGSSVTYVTLVQIQYTEGEAETYALPLAFTPDKDSELLRQKEVGHVFPGKDTELLRDGRAREAVSRLRLKAGAGVDQWSEGVLYEALGDKAFLQALLEGILRRRRFKGSAGELAALATRAFHRLQRDQEPAPEPALFRTEPGKSLVLYGDRWVLKMFRRVEPGGNPAVEIGRFLTERAYFPQTLPMAGALEYRPSRGTPMTLAILQGLVPNQGNAWRYTLDALGRYFEKALMSRRTEAELVVPRKQLLDLVDEDAPTLAQEMIGSYLESARVLGQRTAEFHVTLASAPGDPVFAPEPFTVFYQRSLYQSMRSQTRQAFELLRKRLKDLPEAVRQDAQKLLTREEDLLRRARCICDCKVTALRIRCHGDYHLEQVLYTGKDFLIVGFDGEWNRPLSERRLKRSPLRDVASMLRSFHYAALSALQAGGVRPEDVPALEPWVPFWQVWVAVAFLKAYLQAAEAGSFLPKTREERQVLLHFYLLKRAVNELRYELLDHPERVKIPLQGLTQLLQTAG